ncbi:MAG TPA: OmpA family protein [Reyranella sp.]|jgi:outer membrane protein OmpA-like peptidoglycan-associated protein
MWKGLAVLAALLTLVACEGPHRQVASCAATTGAPPAGYVGPCYDGTDRTDRANRDDIIDRTDRTPRDDIADRTDRTNRDDITDRTVWCVEPAMVITAPSFMVFFDWDKSDLNPTSIETIARAATAYRAKGGAQIKASGHTDTSGPETYNMALSLRRANAVKDALVRDGVPANDISVVGLGESQPLVKTADGVREAQNRRVEIVIR